MMTRPNRRSILSSGLLALLCGLFMVETVPTARAQSEDASVPVGVAPLRTLLADREFTVPAQVEALNRSRLSAELNARVLAIEVRIGDPVVRDQRLVRLDCRLPRSALAAARAAGAEVAARRVFAEQQVSRATDLQRQRNISEEVAQQRRSELAVILAQADAAAESVRQAALQVERCEIHAPYDAWVVERLVGEGELATPGQALLDLVQRGAAEVSAAVRDSDAEGLMSAPALWFVYDGRRLPLRLRHLLPVVDGVARTREARLEFVEASLAPGTAGRLAWRPPAAVLGAEYLVRRNGVLGLFRVEEDRARFVALPGAVEGQPAATDLPGDTPVVTEGRHRLNDGDRVRTR